MITRKRRSDRSGRNKLRSPGRPPVARHEDYQKFWALIAKGRTTEDAAISAGVRAACHQHFIHSRPNHRQAVIYRLRSEKKSLCNALKLLTHSRFGAGAWNCRFTLSNGQGTALSGTVVFTGLPRMAPAIPRDLIRRATVQRATSKPSRRN